MFDVPIAYTTGMQIVLTIITFATTFLNLYLVTNMLSAVYGERIPLRRRLMFSFLSGTVLGNIWVYVIYLVGGMLDFSGEIYQLVTMTNPLFALLYYYFGVKVLHLPRYKSINLMFQTYVYSLALRLFLQLVARLFFAQHYERFNYLLNAVSLLVSGLLNYAIYRIVLYVLRRTNSLLTVSESLLVKSQWRALALFFLKACLCFAAVVIFPIFHLAVEPFDTVVPFVILSMALIISIQRTYVNAQQMRLNNVNAYAAMLSRSIDEFRGVKHDFYNILNTYGGYIAIGNLAKLKAYHESLLNVTTLAGDQIDLNDKMAQNPALLATIISKMEYAKRMDVNMRVAVMCDVTDMYIRDIDLCRTLGNLLDNAIEAAAASPQRTAMLSIEQKPDGSKLIVITNSTFEHIEPNQLVYAASRDGKGIGLSQSRQILGEYSNCVVQFSSYDRELSAYINIMPK